MKSVILCFFFITFICNFVNVNSFNVNLWSYFDVNVKDNSKERMLVDHGQGCININLIIYFNIN